MNRTFQPYVFFRGRCAEAIEYYKKTIGAEEVMVTRFKDSPEAAGRPDAAGHG